MHPTSAGILISKHGSSRCRSNYAFAASVLYFAFHFMHIGASISSLFVLDAKMAGSRSSSLTPPTGSSPMPSRISKQTRGEKRASSYPVSALPHSSLTPPSGSRRSSPEGRASSDPLSSMPVSVPLPSPSPNMNGIAMHAAIESGQNLLEVFLGMGLTSLLAERLDGRDMVALASTNSRIFGYVAAQILPVKNDRPYKLVGLAHWYSHRKCRALEQWHDDPPSDADSELYEALSDGECPATDDNDKGLEPCYQWRPEVNLQDPTFARSIGGPNQPMIMHNYNLMCDLCAQIIAGQMAPEEGEAWGDAGFNLCYNCDRDLSKRSPEGKKCRCFRGMERTIEQERLCIDCRKRVVSSRRQRTEWHRQRLLRLRVSTRAGRRVVLYDMAAPPRHANPVCRCGKAAVDPAQFYENRLHVKHCCLCMDFRISPRDDIDYSDEDDRNPGPNVEDIPMIEAPVRQTRSGRGRGRGRGNRR